MLPSAIELRYFHEVANSKSYTQAARKLNVSQPSLSFAIKRLENSLNLRLFIRHKQGVTLTRAGEILFERVEQLLVIWRDTYQMMKESHETIAGTVNISCNVTVVPVLSATIASLVKQYPDLKINLKHALTRDIMSEIKTGKTDIGIVYDPELFPEIVLNKITSSDFTLWQSNTRPPINLSDDDVTIIGDFELSYSNRILNLVNEKRLTPVKISSSNQPAIIVSLTQSGCGAGIIASNFVQFLKHEQLVKVDKAPSVLFSMYLAYRPELKEVIAQRVVLQSIKDLIKSLDFAADSRR